MRETQSQLILRLTALRKRVRRRLFAYGVCAVLSSGVAAFLAVMALDWLLSLPPALRMVVAGLFLAGFVWACVRWIVRPMRARLGLDEIAARLEAHFGTLQDRLLSTVDFIKHTQAGPAAGQAMGSRSMMHQVIADTEQVVEGVPLESVLSLRPVGRRVALLALGAALLSVILLISPDWPTTGFYRYVYPWREIEWPTTVSILPLTGGKTVAVGESATVRMRVQRGLTPSLRGVVHLREPDGRTIALTMQREVGSAPADRSDKPGIPEAADFYAVIDAVTRDLTYWFEAGDASTARTPHRLRVVRRPQVIEALVDVEPPPYVSNRTVRVHDLSDGPVRAPIGGVVRVTLRASKPIVPPAGVPPHKSETHLGLRTDTGRLIPLVVNSNDHHELTARFTIDGDLRFRVELTDADGFENRGAANYSILATPDTAPVVTILEPQALTELTPAGSLPLVVRVEDDFGITSLVLESEREGSGDIHTLTLTDRLESVSPGTYGEDDLLRTDDPGPGPGAQTAGVSTPTEAVARFLWEVGSLGAGPLSPGDVVVYSAIAADNCTTTAETGQVGRSAPMRIRIISDIEFDTRLRSDLARLETRIRESALDQADLLDRTTALHRAGAASRVVDDPEAMTETELRSITNLAGRQARLVRRLRDLAGRFYRIAERMELNQAGDAGARSRIAWLGGTLQQVAGGWATAASSALGEAHEDVTSFGQQAALRRASDRQETVVAQLHTLLRVLSQLGSFQELITKTRHLLDRQDRLRRQTLKLGRSTLGKQVDSLTQVEEAELKRAQRKQKQLLGDVEQLLSGMQRRAASVREKDPSGADSIVAAVRAARARDLTKHMTDAAADLEGNRTAAATIAQQKAADAIRKMVAALRERDLRALEELRKRLTQVEDQLAELIKQQEALRRATYEAATTREAPINREAALAEEQRRIRHNTELFGEELAGFDPTRGRLEQQTGLPPANWLASLSHTQAARAARAIREAAAPMARAETLLRASLLVRERNAEPATIAQDEALALLERALEHLEELARQTDDEVLRRSLEQIQEEIEQTLAAQRDVNTGIGNLLRSIEARGRISRKEARAASKLARKQADVRAMVDRSLPEYHNVVVYEWALQRAAEWMDQSRSRLTNRKVDDALVILTDRVVRQLEKLLGAIVETQSLPVDSSFVGAAGGGGHGVSGEYKPVPTVAELFVLKAMQVDINQRTRKFDESSDTNSPTEEQLRELTALGEDQTEVRWLTEKVTERAREP